MSCCSRSAIQCPQVFFLNISLRIQTTSARRSNAGARLIVVYHRPAQALHLIGFVLRCFGELLRSAFTIDELPVRAPGSRIIEVLR